MSWILLSAFIAGLISGCGQGDGESVTELPLDVQESSPQRGPVPVASLLQKIKQRGKLVVLTTNYPTTYYYDRDNQPAGPEYDMTQSFARSLQLDVEYKVYDSTSEVIQALRRNEGDIAASGLTVNDRRMIEFDYGPSYQETQEYLVCHRNRKPIMSKSDLKGVELVVAADSNYIESLSEYPELTWVADTHVNTAALLKEVSLKKVECTISDSTLYDIERRYFIEIQNKYTLARKSELAWMLNKNSDQLKQAINDWFDSYEKEGDLAQVMDKYYGYVEIFDYVDTHKFLARVKTRLPEYKDFFIDAATKNDIDPSLLAAQSYQESHWNRKAKSPTGVRGIMMLTQPVAKSLGVTNRLHARQNIYAGAKFHAKMKKMVEHVDEPDRSWLALAAYNVGRGHFRDAQALAKKLDKDPDRWSEMKLVLPLLSDKKYYKDLRYGYARGGEPVIYVSRIRSYDELLHKHFGEKLGEIAKNDVR
ncbi:MAG: membrane-bound lytic murein transglycosylase MltF [Proteobacteria bacterium]|nr:membrane-bound lytic murein transglycosylase MltF [Pseudomonadota bacterium]